MRNIKYLLLFLFFAIITAILYHNNTINNSNVNDKVTWYWQLQGPLNLNWSVDYYDVDLFGITKDEINYLHSKNITVICYFSAGTAETWREDFDRFPKEVIGNSYKEFPDEYWLDISNFETFRKIIEERLDLAKEKECDGIEPDNLDAYLYNTGFNITINDTIKYALWLSEQAHKRGLLIALKNNGQLVNKLVDYFDLAIVEECFEYDECNYYIPFVLQGKPVLEVEYNLDKNEFCNKAEKLDFSSAKACKELNGCWDPCWI